MLTLARMAAVFYTFFALSLSTVVLADFSEEIRQAEQQLAVLDSSGENAAQRERLQQLLGLYQAAQRSQQAADKLRTALEQLPEKVAELQTQLDSNAQPLAELDPTLPLAELEKQLPPLEAKLLTLEQQKLTLEKQLSRYQDKPIELRNQLAELQQTISDDEDQTLSDARSAQLDARRQQIELEILSIPQLRERDQLQLELLERQIVQLQQRTQQLQDQVQSKRRAEAEQTLNQLEQHQNSQLPEAVQAIADANGNFSDRLREALASTEKAINDRRVLSQQSALISQTYRTIEQQLALADGSFGTELADYALRFAEPVDSETTARRIASVRLGTFELNQQELTGVAPITPEQALTEQQLAQRLQLLETRKNLLSQLRKAYSRELDELTQLLAQQQQINQQISAGQKLLATYLIWVPSQPPVDFSWPAQIVTGTGVLLGKLHDQLTQLQPQPVEGWLRALLGLVVLLLIARTALKYQRAHEKPWSQQIGKVSEDRFSRSLVLLILGPVISLPLPALVLFIGKRLFDFGSPALEPALNTMAGLLWAYGTLIIWMRRPYGLLISHLDVPEHLCGKIRHLLHPLFWTGTLLTGLLIYLEGINDALLQEGIGRLGFIALAGLAGMFWAALWKLAPQINQYTDTQRWWLHARLWLAVLVSVHLLLIIEALLGYVLTGALVMGLLLATAAIMFTVFALYRLSLRWRLIEERRMAFVRAKTRRIEILAAREKNEEPPVVKDNYLDLKSISSQAQTLLKTAAAGVLLVGLWLLYREFIPALSVLDEVVLWQNSVTTSSGVISESITLLSLMTGAMVIILCILAAYNLPGLLELLVLKHLDLAPGTAYAITTITRYSLLMVSIIAGASQLGVEWSKLQWLVAALGVGLGFGLQEIVANLVSGVIILFEKPVRIGDTVTIGGLTGTVSRIQIRATTITDWDRKEVIIPNKTFVTDQLINWSLSDPITRVVITLGVAHGSDTERVRHLMLTAATSNAKVLRDPAPDAYFTAFGNSTLDFELRLFVDSLADRLTVTHEIHQYLDAAFKAEGIEIAFPQLDVHLHPAREGQGPQLGY